MVEALGFIFSHGVYVHGRSWCLVAFILYCGLRDSRCSTITKLNKRLPQDVIVYVIRARELAGCILAFSFFLGMEIIYTRDYLMPGDYRGLQRMRWVWILSTPSVFRSLATIILLTQIHASGSLQEFLRTNMFFLLLS